MKGVALSIVAALLLSGCGTKEYYKALALQQKVELLRFRDLEEARQARLNTPLVSTSYTDSDGNLHTLIVNRPDCGGGAEKIPQMPKIESPADVALKYYDRTLSFAGTIIPFFSWQKGSRTSTASSYSFGDGATFFQTQGSDSPVDYQRDTERQTEEKE